MPKIVISITTADGEADLTTECVDQATTDAVMAAVRSGARPSVDGVLHSRIPGWAVDIGIGRVWSAVDAAWRKIAQ